MTVSNEWFGELTDRQWRAYRRHNVSPADHWDGWVHTDWSGDEIAGWVTTLAALGTLPTGTCGRIWAQRWRDAGFTPSTALDAAQEVIDRLRSPNVLWVWPADVEALGIARQPSLFEFSPTDTESAEPPTESR